MYTPQLCITNECRNSVAILILQKGERNDPAYYIGVSILNTSYNISPKILNKKLQSNSEQVRTETQNEIRI
jgi:hypothetical protein